MAPSGIQSDMVDDPDVIKIETKQTLDSLLHQVLNQALVAVEADGGSLMLVDEKQRILQIKARLGSPRPGRRAETVFKINATPGIAPLVVRSMTSYLCPDVEVDSNFAPARHCESVGHKRCPDDTDSDPGFIPSRRGLSFQSLLSVPIVFDGRVLAVINADSGKRNHFTAAHQRRLESVARQVAEPIANRISILDAVAQVGLELARSPREGGVEHVLTMIANLAVQSLGADVVTLYQYIQERDEFPVEGTGPTIAGDVKDQSPMRRRVFVGDVPWTIVHKRTPGFYADVHKFPFLTCAVERPGETPRPRFVDRESIKSMAALLLPYRASEKPSEEEVVGVMFANYRTPHDFNIDEIHALATFADSAAAAILNARQEEQRQVKLVETIAVNLAHRMSHLAGSSRFAAQIVKERLPKEDQDSRQLLDENVHDADILFGLAKRLYETSKATGQVAKLDLIDLGALLRGFPERIKRGDNPYEVSMQIPPDLPKVKSVDFQLRQLFDDVIDNAVDAMMDKPTGTVTVCAYLNPNTDRVNVEVSDTGCGIPQHICDRLFIPTTTTKKDRLGIGLWWCKTFMQATGGDMRLKETQLGKGSTFLVEIPCPRRDRYSSIAKASTKAGHDVLIVEDHPR